jgi:hypothetical protein
VALYAMTKTLKLMRIILVVLIIISHGAYCQDNSVNQKSEFNYDTFSKLPVDSCLDYATYQISEFEEYFYYLPIDSCYYTILKRSTDNKSLTETNRKESQKSLSFVVNKPDNLSDSIVVRIYQSLVAIGGSINHESPIIYEQVAVKTSFFSDSLNANIYFETLNSEIDNMKHCPPPFERQKGNLLEIIYWFPVESKKEHFQVRCSYLMQNGLYIVKLKLERTFGDNHCN